MCNRHREKLLNTHRNNKSSNENVKIIICNKSTPQTNEQIIVKSRNTEINTKNTTSSSSENQIPPSEVLN